MAPVSGRSTSHAHSAEPALAQPLKPYVRSSKPRGFGITPSNRVHKNARRAISAPPNDHDPQPQQPRIPPKDGQPPPAAKVKKPIRIKHAVPETVVDVIQGHDNLMPPAEYHAFNKTNDRPVRTEHNVFTATLHEIIERNKPPSTVPTQRAETVCESFIWHTIISLLKALVYLHMGKTDHPDEDEYINWKPIVHNFITPQNIFYSEAAFGQKHAHCRLGDFARVVVLPNTMPPIDDLDLANQAHAFTLFAKGEQTGYEAPELLDSKFVEHIPDPASDLWSVGAVAIAMMTGYSIWDLVREIAFKAHVSKNPNSGGLLEKWREQSTRKRLKLLKGLEAGEIAAALPGRYSAELKVFVEMLLSVDPGYRGDALLSLEEAVRCRDSFYGGPAPRRGNRDEFWERLRMAMREK